MDIPMIQGKGVKGRLMVILDWPNQKTWRKQTHIEGDEAKLLDQCLKAVGFTDYYITFAVKEQIVQMFDKKGKKKKLQPTAEQMARGAGILREEILRVQPEKILVAGPTAHAVYHNEPSPSNIRNHRGGGHDYNDGNGNKIYSVTTIPPYYVTGTPDFFRDFIIDLQKLYTRNCAEPLPRIKEVICRSLEDVLLALASLKACSYVTCDTETSGLFPWEDHIEAIGFGAMFLKNGIFMSKTVIIPWELLTEPDVIQAVHEFLIGKTYSGTFVFHNAKFDIQFLTKWIGESLLDMKVRDTLLMNYLIDERPIASDTSPHGLKNLSRVRYDAWEYKFDFDAFWSKPKEERDWSRLYSYLSLDLYYTGRLYYDLCRELPEDSSKFLPMIDNLLMPATLALAEIELEGVYIDRNYLEELGKEWNTQIIELDIRMRQLVFDLGIDESFKNNFNPASPKDIGILMYDKLKLPTGRDRSTDEKTINTIIYELSQRKLRSNWEDIRDLLEMLLEYRGLKKMVGTYVEGLLERTDKRGRLHGSFNLAGTGTGRLSSSNPNLQNIPQAKGLDIRRAFSTAKGRKWLKADYSNLEYRTVALISNDPMMIQAYVDERDIHVEVASAALGVPRDKITKMQRYAAKFIGFGILYGRGAYSIANGPELRGQNWTEKQAQDFIDKFLGQFTGLKAWMDQQKENVVTLKELETPLGRRRRWPFLTTKERAEAQRQALNFPPQSVASDFTLTALVKLHRALKPYGTRIVLTVHDEIDFDAPDEEIPIVAPLIVDIMNNSHPLDTGILPIRAAVDIGPNWGELKEWEPDGTEV